MTRIILITYLIISIVNILCAYKQECAIGPGYWCNSFQNADECGALRHCTYTVWRYNKNKQVDSTKKCEWCEQLLQNTHKAVDDVAHDEELVESTLFNVCHQSPLIGLSSNCVNTIQSYKTTIILLMKSQRYDNLCHLMDVCPKSEAKALDKTIDNAYVNTQSKVLCNVIVRATQELYANQQKTKTEIQAYLKNDCQYLTIPQVVEKCENLVEQYGSEIYAHVASRVESSKICDYIDDFAFQSTPPADCELCTFVLSIAKHMLDMKFSEDKVLLYIDEHTCSRLAGTTKKNCKDMIDKKGKDLIADLQRGISPTLICTHFQTCLDKIIDEKSAVKKDEMYSFLMNNFCNRLGSLKNACEALINKNGTRLLQVLISETNGRDLCYIFGLCQKQSSLTNVQDDPSKCKRCVTDFIRRKHIAEKLVNHSSEFLFHLCSQLPEQDECTKAVNDSINELLSFIRSLDPRKICIELKMCDESATEVLKTTALSHNLINENIIEYIKTDVCPKLGPSSSFCSYLADTEGSGLLKLVSKSIDPHNVCSIIDICPSSSAMTSCPDQCQCCRNKIDIYRTQLTKFKRAFLGNTRIMCDLVPGRENCLQLADKIERTIFTRLDSQSVCHLLNVCPTSQEIINNDQCQTCTNELDTRQYRFQTVVDELTRKLLSFCTDDYCRSRIQTMQQQTHDKMKYANSKNLCQRIGYCLLESKFEPSTTLQRLRELVQHQKKTLDERLRLHDICSEYGRLKSVCEYLLMSPNSSEIVHIYMKLLQKNAQLFNNSLYDQSISTIIVQMFNIIDQGKCAQGQCQCCINQVNQKKNFIKTIGNKMISTLLSACDYCPAKDQCQKYWQDAQTQYGSYVDNIDSKQVCTRLSFCKTASLCKNTSSSQQLCQETQSDLVQSDKEDRETLEHHLPHASVAIISTESKKTNEISHSNSTCILCEYAMHVLSNYIHQNSTEKEIEQGLEILCNKMPSTVRKQCHELIEDYGPPIIAILIREFDFVTVCRKLNLCTKQMNAHISHLTKANEAACSICDYVSTYVRFALKRDSSDKSLQRALSTVCTRLLHEQHAQCQILVQLFAPHFRQLELESNSNFCQPLTICQIPMSTLKPAINLKHLLSTTAKDEKDKNLPIQSFDVTPECMLCDYAVSYLDAILKNNKSEAAIDAALEKVCTILPRKDRAKCIEFIQTYGPVIAQMIANSADPDAICRSVGLCQVNFIQGERTTESKPIIPS